MTEQNKCTCAESGNLTCPAHPPIEGITPSKFDMLLRCLPQSPYRDRFTMEIVSMQDQFKAVTDERDSAIQAALKEGVLVGEEQMRHRGTQAKLDEALARIKASQEQEFLCNERLLKIAEKYGSKLRFVHIDDLRAFYLEVAQPPVISSELELQAEIERLKAELSKFQTSEFNPDWSMLQASQESLREHMLIVKELTQRLVAQQAMFHVNMLRAYPEKSRDEIIAAINSVGGSEELNKLLAEAKKQAMPEGWQLIRTELLDSFPELNTGNYTDGDVCRLNQWGIDVVLSAVRDE